MFICSSLIAFVFVSKGLAATPPGFEPTSSQDLQVAFCDNLAVDGADIPQEGKSSILFILALPDRYHSETEMSPAIGTTAQLAGTYAILMIDTDTPLSAPGGEAGAFLHLMQTGLTSSNETTRIAGQEMFELENKDNAVPLAAFIQPNPPNQTPTIHKYVTLLLNTTGNDMAMAILEIAARTRTGFNTADVVERSGATVVAGNWFNVTNAMALGSKMEVRKQPDGEEDEKLRKMHIKKRNPITVATTAARLIPTVVPATGGVPKFTLMNTTIVRGIQRTIIIIRINGTAAGSGGQNRASFTTPKVVTETPQSEVPGLTSTSQVGIATGAPFPNGTTSAVMETGGLVTETSALPGVVPSATSAVPAFSTGGAAASRRGVGGGGGVIMAAFSALIAAFVVL
jgi:phosphatidylethanolamine-binding protein